MASQDHEIHSYEECVPEGSDYFQQTLGRRRSSTHKKRREDGSNWRSKESLIHLSIWITNNDIMNEEDNEDEGSRRSLPMKQIKISIQLSYCFVMHLFIFSWCIMHDRMFENILLIYMWWVSSSWCYTNLHF